jgi:hypothetical protein
VRQHGVRRDTAGSPFETKVLTAPVGGNLVGNTVVAGCEWPGVTQNEIYLLGGANLGLRPTVVLGNTVCNQSFRTLGVLSCVGSTMPKISFTALYDADQVEEKRKRGAADRSASGHETV